MGVVGLLTILKSIHKPCNIKDFHGKTIAIDAYGWLHRGAVACAIELATGKPTTKFVEFAMHRVNMLLRFGVKPYLVFDGDRLPSKAGTEKGRADRRKASRALGLEYLRANKVDQAYQELQKAIDITPEMAGMLIDTLKRHGIQYVVAPYEADSQMAYLERQGAVDAILSEDSDLLVFGAKCLLTKLDQYGDCIVIKRSDFTACLEINLTGWTDKDFRCMAILSGCDYLEGIPRMGLKTAHRLVRKYKTIERVLRGAQWDGKFRVPPDYLQEFEQADKTFLYQYVFCPEARQLVHHTTPPSPEVVEGLTYIGAYVEPEIAVKVAAGDINPTTKEKIIPRTYSNGPKTPFVSRIPQLDRSKILDGSDCKSIETFFKPKRTPLAELSPNVFTPSPSQQHILDQQGRERSWDPVTAPSTRSASASQTSFRRPAPLAPARGVSNAITLPQPKRQRLCAEPADDDVAEDACLSPVERSRFFPSTAPELDRQPRSPNTKQSRKKKSEFELWSDDSLEGAMAEMPVEAIKSLVAPVLKHSKASKASKGLKIFCDESTTISKASAQAVRTSPMGSSKPTAKDSKADEEDPISLMNASTLEEANALRAQSLKERYKMPSPVSNWPFDDTDIDQSVGTSKPLAVEVGVEAEADQPSAAEPGAEEDSKHPSVFIPEDVLIAESPARQQVTNADLRDTAPTTPTQHHALPAQVEATPLKGSEDLLVPDSDRTSHTNLEEEWQDSGFFEGSTPMQTPTASKHYKELDAEDDEGKKPTLNLSRFAYGLAGSAGTSLI